MRIQDVLARGDVEVRLLQDLEDPYIFKGSGDMGSFEPLKRRYLPIRIDWTLHSKNIESFDQHIDHIDYSDHYPLVTTIGPPRAIKIETTLAEE